MRKITLLLFVAVALVACNNSKPGAQNADTNQPQTMTVDQFFEKGESLIGKTIAVEGVADHVCKHGGKRMFILGSTPENRLKITTGEGIASFDVAYEGSKIVVEGAVEMLKMDSVYLANWEMELTEQAHEKEHGEGDGHGEGEGDGKGEGDGHDHDHSTHGEQADMGEHIPGMEKVNKYKEEIKTNELGYIPIYSVVATKVNVAETK